MKRLHTTFLFHFILFPFIIIGQHNGFEMPVAINSDGNTPHESAVLDVNSSTKGVLLPRIPFCEIESIENPAEGLMIYDTEFDCLRIYINDVWHCLSETKPANFERMNITGWSNMPLGEDYDTDIAIDSEESVYVTTKTEDDEIRLVKYSKQGDELWTILEVGQDLEAVEVDQNDFVFVVGEFSDLTSEFNGIPLVLDEYTPFIAKISPDGTSTTIKFLDIGYLGLIARTDAMGNLILLYRDHSNQVILKKYDGELNLIWSTAFETSFQNIGDTGIEIDVLGNIVVTGYNKSGISIPMTNETTLGLHNFYVVKFDGANGQVVWSNNIGFDQRISVEDIFIQDNIVFVIGSENYKYGFELSTLYPYGEQFYVARFSLHNGALYQKMLHNRRFSIKGSTHNKSKDQIALNVVELVDGKAERKILLYSLVKREFVGDISVSFSSYNNSTIAGNKLKYNASGNRIYGIDEGNTVGNSTIGPLWTSLVFKVQTN